MVTSVIQIAVEQDTKICNDPVTKQIFRALFILKIHTFSYILKSRDRSQ